MKKDFYIWLSLIILGGVVVFWAGSIIAYRYWDFQYDLDSVVLTFVGILATFVVVSNYAREKDIKDEFSKAQKEMKEENKKEIEKVLKKNEEIRAELKTTKERIEKLKENNCLMG